jgi:hypothetical protein
MSETPSLTTDVSRYHQLIHAVNNDPRHTQRSRLQRLKERTAATPIDRALTPQEKAYLHAHYEHSGIHHAARIAAVDTVSLTPREDGGRDGRNWEDGADFKDVQFGRSLADHKASAEFAADVRRRVLDETGVWYGDDLEKLLADPTQAYLYARAAAVAIGDTFGDRTIYGYDVDNLLRDQDLGETNIKAARNVLVGDGVLQQLPHSYVRADLGAIALIGGEAAYMPPALMGLRPEPQQ